MSAMPTNQEALLLAQVLKKAELEARNKLLAKEQLMRIQILLAKKAK